MLVADRVHDSVLSTFALVKIRIILDGRPKTSGEFLYTPAMLLDFLSKHNNCIVSPKSPIAST